MTPGSTSEALGDDRAVAERARRGDVDAFGALVRRHGPVAHRVAYLITRSAAEADDALQDGTVKAFYAIDRFQADRPFRPWFIAIVANEARNKARSVARREVLRLRATPDVPGPGADEAAIVAEQRANLLRLVEALPEKLRRAVILRHVLGFDERETAEVLGIRPGTVKSRVSRALEALRRSIEEPP